MYKITTKNPVDNASLSTVAVCETYLGAIREMRRLSVANPGYIYQVYAPVAQAFNPEREPKMHTLNPITGDNDCPIVI